MGNPMSLLNQLMSNNNAVIPNPFGQQSAQTPPINQMQFKQFLPRITNDNLKEMVIQARQQGISEEEIEKGLNFIMEMR